MDVIHDKLGDLADQSETRPERDQKRETTDLVFHRACLCSGCDQAKAHQLLVGVRIGALCLPWKRAPQTRGAGIGTTPATEAAGQVAPEDQLLKLWQTTCAATAPNRRQLQMPNHSTERDPEREMLKQIDSSILKSGLPIGGPS